MLIPVLGRAGSGKTAYLMERLRLAAQTQERLLLIVPEQFSFEMEKAVYRSLPAADALKVEVYSFTRLCDKVFARYGGAAGERISDPARYILMSLALDQLRDRLTLYKKPAASTAFVGSMLEMVAEFKNAGVSPDRLREFCVSTKDEQLGRKVGELGEIYHYYQALAQASYVDEKDHLARCTQLLHGRGYFKNTVIFVDSFMTFMAAERRLMGVMLEECDTLYLAMPADNLELSENSKQERGANFRQDNTFLVVKETTLQIISDAKRLGRTVAAPVYLRENHRTGVPELLYLEREFPALQKKPYQGTARAIRLVQLSNPYEEVRFVAAQICKAVREQGIRYREIVVIARSLDRYETAIEDLFSQYEIPVFWDRREDVQAVPLLSFLLTALEAVRTNYDTQQMLALGKSTLLGLEYAQVSQLENYCYLWSTNHSQWVDGTGFSNHPEGLVERFTPEDRERLEQIQRTAQAIALPVQRLRERLENCTGKGFAQALYAFLEESRAKENMLEYARRRTGSAGEERYLELNSGAWDSLMEILDIFCATMEEVHLPLDRFVELFRCGVLCCDLGSIPNTLDQVTVGAADRIRPNSPKVAFVMGMNQGEFPPELSENGLFSDTERDALLQGGIQLNPSVLRRSSYERYFLYAALTAPSHCLTVTWHNALLSGEGTPPSPVVSELRELFPGQQQDAASLPWEDYLVNQPTAFDLLCQRLREDTPQTAALLHHLSQTDSQPQINHILQVLRQGEFCIQDRKVARVLFGERMRLSPSRVENYFLCPFSYFCSGGLRLKPRRKVEFSPMQSGTIIHYVLEEMVSRHGGKGLARVEQGQLGRQVQSLLRQYLENRVSREETLTKRFTYLFGRLTDTLTRLLAQLGREFAQSEFEPALFELPIAGDSLVQPLELRTVDGVRLQVEGVVDRVDIMERDGRRYVRVVDYKSGSKLFHLDDIYYGLNLQMLIYLFSIWENGREELEDVIPAGVLYLPTKDPIIPAQRNTPDSVIEKEHIKKYRMNGLVLNDPVCIQGMEQKVEGLFIPVKQKSDGTVDGRSSVASLAQLGSMKRYVEGLLTQMADGLSRGSIPASPAQGLDYDPCRFCDFRPICQHQREDPARVLEELGRRRFFESIQPEEDRGTNLEMGGDLADGR